MLIVDLHLDLAMNAISWNRDIRMDVHTIRRHEDGMTQKGRARGTVSLPELVKGEIGVSSATVIARLAMEGNPYSGYNSQAVCYAVAQGQLAYYRVLETEGHCQIIRSVADLDSAFHRWNNGADKSPLAFVISMEGADPIVSPDQVQSWYDDGLRIISLVHYGRSAYAGGTGTVVGLTDRAKPLLEAMQSAGMILDTTHLSDESFWEVIELWQGPMIASHQMARALCPGERQFTDEQLKILIERGGIIGAALDAWMFTPGWIKGVTENRVCSLEMFVDHIDYVCQMAGNSDHAAIGTDLDGGYGQEQTPHDLDTIADLQKVPRSLAARGYTDEDIRKIMYENAIRFLRAEWE